MDRRSWLWRRKSSEKSPGETESSGSISSHSERFSDDQANATHTNTQSPEVNSKVVANDVEVGENVKALTEKLSAALLSVSAKEELVKQHSRVAEEAVTGWEKAEKELSSIKLQLDAVLKKNAALEDRVGHLDGALKECVRQLRQAKEEQEEKLQEAIARRTKEWESRKTELDHQLMELQVQLETAKAEAAKSLNELRSKLEASEKESSSSKLELFKLSQRLEVRTLERDLSAKTAESASKHHLESVKKVAKLEAECRRLKSFRRKASFKSDHRMSSAYADSLTDTQSEYGERLQAVENEVKKIHNAEMNDRELSHSQSSTASALDHNKGEMDLRKNAMVDTSQIGLMDDFLEMERLASLPEAEHKKENTLDKDDRSKNPLKPELESIISRTSILEEKIEKLEAEKLELVKAMNDHKVCLETSQDELLEARYKLVELEAHLTECQSQLNKSNGKMKDAEFEIIELQSQLIECQEQLKTTRAELNDKEAELLDLRTQFLEHQEQLKASRDQFKEKETELVNMKTQFSKKQDELNTSQRRLEDKEIELAGLQRQLTQKEGHLRISQEQLKEAENKLADTQAQLTLTIEMNVLVEGELKAAKVKREEAELQVKALESETKSLSARISILAEEAEKERALSAKATSKCQELEMELLRLKQEAQPKLSIMCCNEDLKLQQEKELAVAAGRLAECQKTIASLGKQLKSLSSLEEFLVEPEKLLEFSGDLTAESPLFYRKNELGRLPSIDCQ